MDNIITSSNNSLIKEINKLRKKKYRNEYKLFVIETKKLISEAINSNMKIKYIFRMESSKALFEDEIVLQDDLFKSVSKLVTPDGYLAIVQKKERRELSEKILILDNIQDPGNLGTLIRSCEAFGFNTIISINSVDFYNEKVLRSTMGSLFRLNLLTESYEFLNKLDDYTFYIADMDGKDYRNISSPTKIALVIGNEGNGISSDILKFRHKKIKIPMKGNIESLNAAISGSILMAKFS